ncbi:hypothetical protein BKA93DRAFT_13 [Sparassis latifolia]
MDEQNEFIRATATPSIRAACQPPCSHDLLSRSVSRNFWRKLGWPLDRSASPQSLLTSASDSRLLRITSLPGALPCTRLITHILVHAYTVLLFATFPRHQRHNREWFARYLFLYPLGERRPSSVFRSHNRSGHPHGVEISHAAIPSPDALYF